MRRDTGQSTSKLRILLSCVGAERSARPRNLKAAVLLGMARLDANSMAMPSLSHQKERLNRTFGLAKRTPSSDLMARGRPRSRKSCSKAPRRQRGRRRHLDRELHELRSRIHRSGAENLAAPRCLQAGPLASWLPEYPPIFVANKLQYNCYFVQEYSLTPTIAPTN